MIRREFRQFEVVLVRRRQDQAVARPDRPPGLLQGSQRRNQRRAGRARPGRPEHQRGREAHRQPAAGRGLFQRRKAGPVVLDQAGKRLRHRQLPRRRGQHQQVQPQRSSSIRSIRTSRPTASRARSTCTTARRGRTKTRAATTSWPPPARACASACRSASWTRCFSAAAWSAPRSSPAPTSRPPTWPMPTGSATPAPPLPLTIGWSRDNRDSAIAPNSGRFQRLAGEVGVAGDARYLRGNYQFQQYVPLNKQFTLAFNGEAGLGQGPGRPAVPGVQELLLGRPGFGARLRPGHPGPART